MRSRLYAAAFGVVLLALASQAGLAGAKAAPPVDTTPPRITVSANPPANANGWNDSKVTVHFACSDPGGSGVKSCPAKEVVSDDVAAQVVTGTAVDKAGNTATASITVHIDPTAPVVSAIRQPAANAAGWNNVPVIVSFTAADALSGVVVDSITAPIQLSEEGTDLSVVGRATDRAGNVGRLRETGIKIDMGAPDIAVTVSPEANLDGTRTAPVTVHFTCADPLSGISTCPADQILTDAGINEVSVTATDNAGNSAAATVRVNVFVPPPPPPPPPPPLPDPPACRQLFPDPGFESGISGFDPDPGNSVTRVDVNPLEGAYSARVSTSGNGNGFWWLYDFTGGTASHLNVRAHLRSDADSASSANLCAVAYYADDGADRFVSSCAPPVSGITGDKDFVTADLALDQARALQSVGFRLTQDSDEPLSLTMDSTTACLDVVTEPIPSGGGGEGGGGGGGGGGGEDPVVYPNVYPGFVYHLPATGPFISLDDYARADVTSTTAYVKFKNAADIAVADTPPYTHTPYNYSAAHSVIMYRITGDTQYLDDAIERVERQVAAAEALIAIGERPALSDDSYLEVGWYIEQLALAYDYGYNRLSDTQRQRWSAYAEQALYNVWNPDLATWGGVPQPWSGWSINDPGNNYHYSFLRATMLWALASQNAGSNMTWFEFLQAQKFVPLTGYFSLLPGGGSREGTGYGTAHKNLFENYIYWKASTGEDLANISSHTRDTIDYWVHATVPTLDRFAPIGDQSRSAIPELYDYHENLVHTAVALQLGLADPLAAAAASRGTWWLGHNSVVDVYHDFNRPDTLLPYAPSEVAPTDLVYHASAVGHFFARSSWNTDASWLAFVAGPFDQSHAHEDQGSFTFFKRDWLAVTSNIWSNSGIHQEVDVHNVVRFVKDGATIPQNRHTTQYSSMTYTANAGQVEVSADLTNAYWRSGGAVTAWTRQLVYNGDTLTVHDACTVAAGVEPVWQLHVPVAPVVSNGVIQAGGLLITPMNDVTITVAQMQPPDFSRGYRIELRPTTPVCAFDVVLQAN